MLNPSANLIILSICLFLTTAVTAQVDLNKGLVAFYPFNGNANDISGSNLHGTPQNGPQLTTDRFGNVNSAYLFDGLDDNIIVHDNGKLSEGTFTLAYYFNTEKVGTQIAIGKINEITGEGATYNSGVYPLPVLNAYFGIMDENSGCAVQVPTTLVYTLFSTAEIKLNQWYCLVCVFEKGTQYIYLDGILIAVATRPFQNAKGCTNTDFIIGSWWQNDRNYFQGKLDDIRYYNRALSPAEVSAICDAPVPPALCTGTLGAPVVNIDFGTDTNPTAPLEQLVTGASTTLTFKPVSGNPAQPTPLDGEYTITNNVPSNVGWFVGKPDHTPGDVGGNMIFFNASVQPGEFYRQTVPGLCANTTYEFAAWIANVVDPSVLQGVLPDLSFQIEKTDGTPLGTFNTGGIPQNAAFSWKQYGFLFTTPSGVNTVVIKLINNNVGGIDQAGNDLAIDDITFRPCGPQLQASFSSSQIMNSQTQCSNTTLPLYGSISDITNNSAFKWQVSADTGKTWTDIPNSNSLQISWTVPSSITTRSYQFRILSGDATTINSASCRIISEKIDLIANALPSGTLTGQAACAGSNPMLTFTSVSGSGPAFALVIQEGSTVTGEKTINSAIAFSALKPLQGTTLYTLVSIRDGNGCVNNAPGTSVSINASPLPDAIFTALQGCINDSARIEFKTAFPSPLDFTYSDGGRNVTITGASNGKIITLPTLLANQTSIQLLSLSPQSGTGCTRSSGFNPSTIVFPVSPAPAISFDPVLPVCEGSSPVVLTSARETSGLMGNGSYSGQYVSNGFFDPVAAGPGAHQIRYTFVGTNGCSSFADQVVPVASRPVANAGPDLVTCINTPLQLRATGGTEYLWSPRTGLSDPTISNPVILASGPTQLIVTVKNEAGCTASDTINIAVAASNKTGFTLPNAFTPNGDGKNDCFGLQHWGITSKVDLKIFNRWGQLVFSTQDGSKCWDGTLGGKPQRTDTYVYTVSAVTGCGPIQLKGVINLLR